MSAVFCAIEAWISGLRESASYFGDGRSHVFDLAVDGVAYSTSGAGLAQGSAVYLTSDGGATWKRAATTNPGKTASDVELVRSPAATVIVVAPGIFASATSDWGGHWRAVGLPDVYPSYKGFAGAGGWSG